MESEKIQHQALSDMLMEGMSRELALRVEVSRLRSQNIVLMEQLAKAKDSPEPEAA